MSITSSQLWVGVFEDGEVVVFDPEAQPQNDPDWVYLWSNDTQRTERYAKEVVKKAIRKVVATSASDLALSQYNLTCSLINKRVHTVFNPQGIKGPWKTGIILDWHTTASQMVGENEFGHPIFETQRSEVGELLYQFKYRNDQTALAKMLTLCNEYLVRHASGIFEIILPIPPSNPTRVVTKRIAEGIAAGLGAHYSGTALRKIKSTTELKSITDPEGRKELLRDAFQVDKAQVQGKVVLLVDDLYRSGATLEAAAEAVASQGNPKGIYVLAITRTRVHR